VALCRGAKWGVSWGYVVENMVCRGEHVMVTIYLPYVVAYGMSWPTVDHDIYACSPRHRGCRGGMSWGTRGFTDERVRETESERERTRGSESESER
jgi:hypothetical protein